MIIGFGVVTDVGFTGILDVELIVLLKITGIGWLVEVVGEGEGITGTVVPKWLNVREPPFEDGGVLAGGAFETIAEKMNWDGAVDEEVVTELEPFIPLPKTNDGQHTFASVPS